MGKLIVIEGLDASGKQTQTALICDALRDAGYKVKQISFPCYDSESSALVKMYLNGKFGSTAENVNAYAASSFYAVDRYASFKTDWEKDYNSETIVIADRYTTSNMIHQAGKISDLNERNLYLDWLYEYEFKYLGLPKPDKVLFLEMPPEVSEKLMKERANKITGNAEKDIHEKDKNHLVKSYESALYVAQRFEWDIVHCVQDNNLRTIEDIHSEILQKVLKEVK
ncbi:MAG: deoxynucleoside kinase [Clostridia bacterium]|nr:deoxynucleoside kinase [Clostridia bacterium]